MLGTGPNGPGPKRRQEESRPWNGAVMGNFTGRKIHFRQMIDEGGRSGDEAKKIAGLA
jgi:hypothetical protein